MRPPSCLGSTVQGAVQGGGVDQHMHRAVIGAGGHCTGRAGVGQGARVCDTTGSQLLHFSASQPRQPRCPLAAAPCLTRVGLHLHKGGALEGGQAAAAASQHGYQLILQDTRAGCAAGLLGRRGTDMARSRACG